MLRFLTAGESHGPELVVIVEGLPAGVAVDGDAVDRQLVRRQQGYGRGARSTKIERDHAEIVSGVAGGTTTGAPVAMRIVNQDFANQPAAPVPLTAPRPGHADLAGRWKYGHEDFRVVRERASARETAARVAAGALARSLLDAFGVRLGSFVTSVGDVSLDAGLASLDDESLARLAAAAEDDDRSLPRSGLVGRHARRRGRGQGRGRDARRHLRRRSRSACPIGLGSPRALGPQARRATGAGGLLDPRGQGRGGGAGLRRGTAAGNPGAGPDRAGGRRALLAPPNFAGGLEAGMTNGQPVVVRAAMKPLSSVRARARLLRLRDRRGGRSALRAVGRVRGAGRRRRRRGDGGVGPGRRARWNGSAATGWTRCWRPATRWRRPRPPRSTTRGEPPPAAPAPTPPSKRRSTDEPASPSGAAAPGGPPNLVVTGFMGTGKTSSGRDGRRVVGAAVRRPRRRHRPASRAIDRRYLRHGGRARLPRARTRRRPGRRPAFGKRRRHGRRRGPGCGGLRPAEPRVGRRRADGRPRRAVPSPGRKLREAPPPGRGPVSDRDVARRTARGIRPRRRCPRHQRPHPCRGGRGACRPLPRVPGARPTGRPYRRLGSRRPLHDRRRGRRAVGGGDGGSDGGTRGGRRRRGGRRCRRGRPGGDRGGLTRGGRPAGRAGIPAPRRSGEECGRPGRRVAALRRARRRPNDGGGGRRRRRGARRRRLRRGDVRPGRASA